MRKSRPLGGMVRRKGNVDRHGKKKRKPLGGMVRRKGNVDRHGKKKENV